MKIEELDFKGVYEIQLEAFKDQRGFFMRTYEIDLFKEKGLHRKWIQENHSYNAKKNIIRGLHFQFPPHGETKLVRVSQGKIFDVYVDLRKKSKTFGKWGSIILSGENKKMLYLPRGFAHGICVLEKDTTMLYKMDNYYMPKYEGSIKWDDSELNINWPLDGNPIISERDSKAKSFEDFIKEHGAL